MNPFGVEKGPSGPSGPSGRGPVLNVGTPFSKGGNEGGINFETRRAELYPEVRSHVDKLYAELQSIYAKYFVKSVKEMQEKAEQGLIPLKVADVARIKILIEELKKLLETNSLQGFERILTLGPNDPMFEWHASDGHIYIERKNKNGEKSVLLDGKNEVYRGRFKGCLVRDGEVYVNEAEGSRTHLDISRAGLKKRFGFEKRVVYRGPGQRWEVSDGKTFIEDSSFGRFKIFIVKKHHTFGADETELIYEDDGRSAFGRPQYHGGHAYISVRGDSNGEYAVLKDGKPWKRRSGNELWTVEDGKLVEYIDHFDGTRERFVDGVKSENHGKKYGNHYYSVRGPNGDDQIVQDGQEVIIEKALGWRFNEDALYVRVPNPDGGSIFIRITGNY